MCVYIYIYIERERIEINRWFGLVHLINNISTSCGLFNAKI